MVRPDQTKCREIGSLLRKLPVPEPAEEGQLLGVGSHRLADFYFLVVAICHQTSPTNGPALSGLLSSGERCFGWDYLRKRLAERITQEADLLEAMSWVSMTAARLNALLADATGVVTLTGAERRAELIRDLGMRCVTLGIKVIGEIYDRSEGWLEGGSLGGLFSLLGQFAAYQDPVRKKSCFFLELMRGQCHWKYRDPQNLGAPVDYHEVRGHIRIGTVVIEDMNLRQAIQERREVNAEQDLAIRQAVYGAIDLISRELGSSDPATLHYLFWNVFRNCCRRDIQHCGHCDPSCGLPLRYREAFASLEAERCVFASVCTSAGRPNKLIEHQHETDYY